MPQKRNPVIVATIRTYSRLVATKVAGICTAASVGFEASRDVTVAWEDVLECVETANGMTKITEACISGLKFNPDAMGASLKYRIYKFHRGCRYPGSRRRHVL